MILRLTRFIALVVFVFLCTTGSNVFGQGGELRGSLTDSQTKEPLVGATVTLVGTKVGTSADASGKFSLRNIDAGTYTVRIASVGYVTAQRRVTIGSGVSTLDLALDPSPIEASEVIIEVNRARERETPVAFTTVGKQEIDQKIHGQDAPLLVKNVPGVYAYSTDGVGNGEAKLLVRGFNQNYVQVLINGVPTNDPESNAVYWSNWGSVSGSAASVQVQRGAGSSLYGAGSFGGSFNIVTEDALAKPFYGLKLSVGDPTNTIYGVSLNSGLLWDSFAAALRIENKVGEGSRISGRYEGINYYTSLSWFINPVQSLKFVLHGAPQEHGYSFSNNLAYFLKYGYKANSAPFIPTNVMNQLPNNPNSNLENYGLNDNSRELKDNNYTNLSHNFFHKPQAELHYRYDLDPTSSISATAFYSMGRGGGSSINSGGTTFRINADSSITSLLGPDGTIIDPKIADTVYLKNAFQRISYSLHQQSGILVNYDMKPVDFAKVTVGGEFRSWSADHPGHFTNLFGKTSTTASYARKDTSGKIMTSTFSRRVYQGDLEGPDGDIGNIFGWDLAGDKDATYKTQYRNYLGETPQYTIFAHANWLFNGLNILTSVQYVWYKYQLKENMPSENAIGTMITRADEASRGSLKEGPTGNGKFLMQGTDTRWYEFKLIDTSRSRGFIQPKIGLNYNFDEHLNVFANFAHVERFVDLGVYYNQGALDPTVEDEKSNQYELGIGWSTPALRAKLNAYMMTWENKATRIQDISKAGLPGYDRNGFRSELVGSSNHKGIEFEFLAKLDEFIPVKGFKLNGSLSVMDNTWTEILDKVLVDPNLGTLQEDKNLNGTLDTGEDTDADNRLDENRRVFNASALDANGKRNAMYFSELKDTKVASGPQFLFNLGLGYEWESLFAGVDMNLVQNNYLLDGGSYMAVDGALETRGTKEYFLPKYDNVLPTATIVNAQVGYKFNLYGFRGSASVQGLNLLNAEYLADADRFGVIPGMLRAFRFNIVAGI